MLSFALAGLRARGARTLLSAAGVLAASLVVGTGVTVGFGLATGFERSADRSDLPDVIARFDDEKQDLIDAKVRALPNLADASYRYERLDAHLRANGHETERGALQILCGGRRGYEIVEGRDLSDRPGEVVVERGLADAWDLELGDQLDIGRRIDEVTVVGVGVVARQRRLPARHHRARLHRREHDRAAPRLRARRRQPRAACGSTTRARPTSRSRRRARSSFGLGKLAVRHARGRAACCSPRRPGS